MTTVVHERVTFTARHPVCGHVVTWVEERDDTRVRCGVGECGECRTERRTA